MLAQKLAQVTKSKDGIRLAEEIFAGQHQRATPAVVEVSNEEDVAGLLALCAQYEIMAEVI